MGKIRSKYGRGANTYYSGDIIERAARTIYNQNRKESDDTKNRKYVVEKLLQNMEKGISEEEAIELIMQDEIIKEFDYLKNNGLDLKVCFSNWLKNPNLKKPQTYHKEEECR